MGEIILLIFLATLLLSAVNSLLNDADWKVFFISFVWFGISLTLITFGVPALVNGV